MYLICFFCSSEQFMISQLIVHKQTLIASFFKPLLSFAFKKEIPADIHLLYFVQFPSLKKVISSVAHLILYKSEQACLQKNL